jgi:hypothetical protein
MKRPARTVTTVVLGLGLLMSSACAGDGGDDGDAASAEIEDGAAAADAGTTSSSTAPAGPPPYANPAEMAQALGCTDYVDGQIDSGPLEHRQATGSCTFEGAEVDLDVFASAEDLAAYEEVGETAGCDALVADGYSGYSFAVGDRWAASVFDLEPEQATVDRMASRLGGETRSITC